MVVLLRSKYGLIPYQLHPFMPNEFAETGIFRENGVNAMAADALAPNVARISTVMGMIIKDKRVITFINPSPPGQWPPFLQTTISNAFF